MGGAAVRQVSAVPDVPSPIPAMGARRQAGEGLRALAEDLLARGQIGFGRDLHRRHLRGGEKGGRAVGPTRRGKGTKIMAIADRHGLPVAAWIGSASPHETRFVEATVEQRFTAAPPERMIGDRAYDSDPLDRAAATATRHRVDCAAQESTGASPTRRTGASCGAIAGVGRSNDCLPGCITFVGWSPVGSITRPTSSGSSSLAASSF